MKPNIKILVCDVIDEEGISKLRRAGFVVDKQPLITFDRLKNLVPNYDVLIVRSRTKITKEIIMAGIRLKIVGRAGAGLDNVDLEAARKRQIRILNTPEAPSGAVAELTLGLILSLARAIPRADRAMKEGKWIKKELIGWELKEKTLGMIGLGRIGVRVAKLAKAFEMNVLITTPTPPNPALLKELEAECVPLFELLARSDIVTIHIPLTPKTYHMIGKKELLAMKKKAYLINTSRGAIINETALIESLQSGKLGGAALDVFEVESPKNWSLIRLPNVVCTPHIGAQTKKAQKMTSLLLAEKIISALHDI